VIAAVYGTTGELIKLAPVLVRLEKRGAHVTTWCTGQQAPELLDMVDALGVPHPDIWFAEGLRRKPISTSRHVVWWALVLAYRFVFHFRELRKALRADEPSLVVVHGDTFTTVVGSVFGRLLGVPVAHVEAGMRSHNLRNPFPEEMNRRLVAKVVNIHFAPGRQAVDNLAKESGVVVDTGLNTVCDSLDLVPEVLAPSLPVLPEGYGVVSLHRFELLRQGDVLRSTMETLAALAQEKPMVFVDHPPTAARIKELGLDHVFDDEHLIRIPKLDYLEFVAVVRGSGFIVTDSGGLQQESAHMNHPCLVHRLTTESPDGLGRNVVVSKYDLSVLEDFVRDPDRFRGGPGDSLPSPSDIVVDWLDEHGYCAPNVPVRAAGRPPVDLQDPDGFLSVVVPIHQDEAAIEATLSQIVEALDALGVRYEVIVAATRSAPSAGEAVWRLGSDQVRYVFYDDEEGKGNALRHGFKAARGTHVAFIDGGMELHADGIGRLLEILEDQDLDVVVGAKPHPESKVYYPPFRRFQSGTFRQIVRLLFDLDVGDTQTGLKVFRRDVLDDVLSRVTSHGFAFDLELLVAAHDVGYRIGEGPVHLDYRFARTTGAGAVVDVLVDTVRIAWRRRRTASA
jgi:UDP-N-acetylglucosamine 2-epimerase (non-hydrolysing)